MLFRCNILHITDLEIPVLEAILQTLSSGSLCTKSRTNSSLAKLVVTYKSRASTINIHRSHITQKTPHFKFVNVYLLKMTNLFISLTTFSQTTMSC